MAVAGRTTSYLWGEKVISCFETRENHLKSGANLQNMASSVHSLILKEGEGIQCHF